MKRRIAFFTGTRAEYGLLRPLMHHIEACTTNDLLLFVSGTHLSEAHGYTLKEVLNDGFAPTTLVPMPVGNGTWRAASQGMASVLTGMAGVLEENRPDILVVLGDRYETLAAALAATMGSVPLAHIHGGEVTEGAIDEAFRHSITKMSHLHFTSCEAYRQRVLQLGEEPQRVWSVGALGVENALSLPLLDETVIRSFLRLGQSRPYFLCTFHPVTLHPGSAAAHWQKIRQALDSFPDHAVIVTGANADPEGGIINHLLAQWAAEQPERVRLFDSLGVVRYLSSAKYAACVVGNSSSGIIEIPSLGVPVVDIGDRQKGRVRSEAVLHCEACTEMIIQTLTQALSPAHQNVSQTATNPYEDEDTSAKIARILERHPLEGLLEKSFFDLPKASL